MATNTLAPTGLVFDRNRIASALARGFADVVFQDGFTPHG
jgi:hypothetical protein